MQDELERVKGFHGHLGIWVTLGYKAGEYARKNLKPEHFKDLNAKVFLNYKTPYSCLLDGIQLSSCCTIGKGNLEFEHTESNNICIIFSMKNKKLRMLLKKEFKDEIIRRQGNDENDLKNVKWLLSLPIEKIFNIKSKDNNEL